MIESFNHIIIVQKKKEGNSGPKQNSLKIVIHLYFMMINMTLTVCSR